MGRGSLNQLSVVGEDRRNLTARSEAERGDEMNRIKRSNFRRSNGLGSSEHGDIKRNKAYTRKKLIGVEKATLSDAQATKFDAEQRA